MPDDSPQNRSRPLCWGRQPPTLGHTAPEVTSGVVMRDREASTAAREPRRERDFVKPSPAEAEVDLVDQSFTDLIACERDCRTCSYAAWLDCDGNCGECPHNGYCPCVNPVVARSKTALRIIELRPLLLQDLQARG